MVSIADLSATTSLALNSWNYVTRPKDEQQSDAIFGGVVWITNGIPAPGFDSYTQALDQLLGTLAFR